MTKQRLDRLPPGRAWTLLRGKSRGGRQQEEDEPRRQPLQQPRQRQQFLFLLSELVIGLSARCTRLDIWRERFSSILPLPLPLPPSLSCPSAQMPREPRSSLPHALCSLSRTHPLFARKRESEATPRLITYTQGHRARQSSASARHKDTPLSGADPANGPHCPSSPSSRLPRSPFFPAFLD